MIDGNTPTAVPLSRLRRPAEEMSTIDLGPGRAYTPAEAEFMKAMDRYKRTHRRPFPTWAEVLEVVRGLGYNQGQEQTVPDVEGNTPAEAEFMKAMDRYKRTHRRPFPTWAEVLEVVRSLGYTRAG